MTKDEMLNLIADKIIKAIQFKLRDNDSVGSGALVEDITADTSGNGVKIEMLDYATYLDTGTRGTETGLPDRKMPPIAPIKRWVEMKGLNISPWGVAVNIKKYGTKPHPFLYVIDDVDITPITDMYITSKIEEMEFDDKKIQLKI